MDRAKKKHSRAKGGGDQIRRYALALAFVGAAFLIREVLASVLKDYSCFLLFAPAAMLASWFGGIAAGGLAFALGLVMGDYFFLGPPYQFGPYQVVDVIQLISYCATTVIALVLIEVVRRSRLAAELAAEETRMRNSQLEMEIAERKRIQNALEEAREQLRLHSEHLEELVAQRTAKLEQTVSALEGFCYTIAHDLRAPLRAMEGFSRALLEDNREALDETGVDYAERICAAARRMDRLIQDLLGYERLTTVDVSANPTSLDALLDAALQRLREEVQARHAAVELLKPLPEVAANAALLEQVLVHLLANALKFSSGPGRSPAIRIWAEVRGAGVRLWIQDNGIGIAPEHQARIFDPFTRLHSQDAYSGNGIGLAFARRALERMGGVIGVESTLGSGSRFWIDLSSGRAAPTPSDPDRSGGAPILCP